MTTGMGGGTPGMGIELPIEFAVNLQGVLQQLGGLGNALEDAMKPKSPPKNLSSAIFFGEGKKVERIAREAADGTKKAFKDTGKFLEKHFSLAVGPIKLLGKGMRWAKDEAKGFVQTLSKGLSKIPGFGRGGIGRRIGSYAGKGAAFAGMLGLRGITGFVTGAFQEAVGAYEAQQNARLGVAPYLTGMNRRGFGNRRARFASGVRLGYNDVQAAQIQAMGARMGMGQSRAAGVESMRLMRGFGVEGLMTGAGMMRRGSAQGLGDMRTKLHRMIAAGVKSGLDDARIGEFLQAANNYAEQQLAVTPGKDDMKNYASQLANMQLSGLPGFKGKYGAMHLGQFDKAIKGAQGPAQSFLMRAFGFGQGASFFNVLQRQERGIGDPKNLRAVMDQLKSEYGANSMGGLSEQALIAFKSMGMGTTHTGKALSKLMYGSASMSDQDRRQKIMEIMEGQKDAKLAPLQRRAYQAIVKRFGYPASVNAKRFSEFAAAGKESFKVKDEMTKAAISGLKITQPIIRRLAIPIAKGIADYLKKNEDKLRGWVNVGIDWVKKIGRGVFSLARSIDNLISTIKNSWLYRGSGETNTVLKKYGKKGDLSAQQKKDFSGDQQRLVRYRRALERKEALGLGMQHVYSWMDSKEHGLTKKQAVWLQKKRLEEAAKKLEGKNESETVPGGVKMGERVMHLNIVQIRKLLENFGTYLQRVSTSTPGEKKKKKKHKRTGSTK